MKKDTITLGDTEFCVYSFNTVVVGSGAAGFNAADSLHSLGQTDIAILTEGVNMGTSRNTGSDKQTYYKLTLAGDGQDSVMDMAKTLFEGGSVNGDIAMVEASLSAMSFYKLVNIGVPFPHNAYGEYIGYKTDHDPRQRATSCGPLTSKLMTQKLEAQVCQKGIDILDGFLVIGILKNQQGDACGLAALNTDETDAPNHGLTLINCTNIIYATGGPAGIYKTSVYPESQTGGSGVAFEAGARGVNLTESQYGIASTKFRWNLSGTYQQVIPRYISTDAEGNDPREFLDEYFTNPGRMLDCIFLKGYQWPFDPRKIQGYGSSIVDILVFNETQVKGRRVFMDFTRNPTCATRDGSFDFGLLNEESHTYLKNSGALFGTPIERLAHMNQPAIDLYKNNGIDLTCELLEIAVCAQHNNGGLLGNLWWESNLRHFFPVGEVNGSFGVYRPGGSALNSTQVGSYRAAQFIHANYGDAPPSAVDFAKAVSAQVLEKFNLTHGLAQNLGASDVYTRRNEMQRRMTQYGAHIRSLAGCEAALEGCLADMAAFGQTTLASLRELPDALRNRDILLTQLVYLSAIQAYIRKGGASRGSYLVMNDQGDLPCDKLGPQFRFSLDDGAFLQYTGETEFDAATSTCTTQWKDIRPLPQGESWFENVWNQYRRGEIIRR